MPMGGARPGAGAPKGTVQKRQRALSHADRLREKINASRIVARMNKVAEGTHDVDDPQVESVRMRAGQILLAKVLPDLARTEVSGPDGNAITIVTRAE